MQRYFLSERPEERKQDTEKSRADSEAQLELMQTKISSLTERQLQILSLVALNKSDKEIAQTCDLSENTINTHLNAIYKIFKLVRGPFDNRAMIAIFVDHMKKTAEQTNL